MPESHRRTRVKGVSRSKWKGHATAVDYGEEITVLSDRGRYCPRELPGGLLVVRRREGDRFDATDGCELSPEEFQMKLATHRNARGDWDPLQLFRYSFDQAYVTVGRDRTPSVRLLWLMERNVFP